MVNSFESVLRKAKEIERKTVSVAVAQDEHVLEAVKAANEQGIANAILVGDEKEIREIANRIDMDLSNVEIINELDIKKAARTAVECVSSKRAHMVMKGLIDTANFLRAVLDKEIGLRTKGLMSHVAVFEIPKFDRLILVTDAAMNKYPDLKEKVEIVKNAVMVSKALGNKLPKVAPICAVEVVNPKMPPTLDAAALSQMNARGQIKGCLIDGPLAIDNALSEEAAKHKGIESPVAGKADIMLMPNIEAGNVMYKTLAFTTESKNGGLLIGAAAPVIVTSRADSYETKMNSIALAALVAELLN
ncbi:phosphate butyryltransferase [Oceanirhabdus seepicola]|uniref:Phosphate butyryltransferase n=1 Tax=Oceanirhabdus seepicola TaxID=2828781 RepID=A0A9J6P031_9CLOT|nr:phosphate butyryltransferase [Oceanirhabdus seepicola]MCM1989708.1 phosphate butyryltransferase [Oceanirhabdus seepicola]